MNFKLKNSKTFNRVIILAVILIICFFTIKAISHYSYKPYYDTRGCIKLFDAFSLEVGVPVFFNQEKFNDFIEVNNIKTELISKDTINGVYVVALKLDSIGIEHHNFKFKLCNKTLTVVDTYTWGATGDIYSQFLMIPASDDFKEIKYKRIFKEQDEIG